MDNTSRITELAQDIYLARHNQRNDVSGQDLTDFLDQTINWVNQLTPEIEKKADWNFVRTNDATVGSVSDADTVSYPLPYSVRKLVVNPQRDLTIRQDGSVVARFRVVNANQLSDPNDYEFRNRVTVQRRKIIFGRRISENEVGGDIIADTVAFIPKLSYGDVSLLDIFDDYPDIRQLYVYGVLKNQILPDIVQGGLTPSYAQKFDSYLSDCIGENNASGDADQVDAENFGWVGGVGMGTGGYGNHSGLWS